MSCGVFWSCSKLLSLESSERKSEVNSSSTLQITRSPLESTICFDLKWKGLVTCLSCHDVFLSRCPKICCHAMLCRVGCRLSSLTVCRLLSRHLTKVRVGSLLPSYVVWLFHQTLIKEIARQSVQDVWIVIRHVFRARQILRISLTLQKRLNNFLTI